MGGLGGPGALRRPLPEIPPPELEDGIGVSGWLCITRRSEARSRYFGVSSSVFCSLFSRADLAFSLATSLRFASL